MQPNASFTGVWLLDKQRSDGNEESLKQTEAGFVLRQGSTAIRGMEVKIKDGLFQFSITTAVPGFKATEKYPLTGEEVEGSRRDMRKGKLRGKVSIRADGNEVVLAFEFDGQQLPGKGEDIFKLVSEDEMHVVSTLENPNGTVTTTKIYNRKKK